MSVLDELRAPFNRDEEGLHPEHPRLRLIRKSDARIPADVIHGAGIVAGEEVAVAVELDLAIVAHGPAGDCAAFGPRR